jgi:hypothetical protein
MLDLLHQIMKIDLPIREKVEAILFGMHIALPSSDGPDAAKRMRGEIKVLRTCAELFDRKVANGASRAEREVMLQVAYDRCIGYMLQVIPSE